MGTRAAEDHLDYRFFRLATVLTSRLVLACLFLVAWNLAFYRDRTTLIFLLTTLSLSLVVSLACALVAYSLFKRRGGRVEKTPKPVVPPSPPPPG